MFNRIALLLLLCGLVLVSCEKVDEDLQETEEALIESLVMEPASSEIEYNELPADIAEEVAENHFETFVETVQRVPNRGYILQLGSGEVLYYTLDGSSLNYRAEPTTNGVFGSTHPHGRCFRRVYRFGQMFPPADLSATITDYLTENYPNRPVRGAKAIGDTTLVLLRPALVVAFGANDEFLGERNPLEHCTDRCREVRPAVRANVVSYLTENFPDATIVRSCARLVRIYVLLETPDGRVIVIFDAQGNYLGQRP